MVGSDGASAGVPVLPAAFLGGRSGPVPGVRRRARAARAPAALARRLGRAGRARRRHPTRAPNVAGGLSRAGPGGLARLGSAGARAVLPAVGPHDPTGARDDQRLSARPRARGVALGWRHWLVLDAAAGV